MDDFYIYYVLSDTSHLVGEIKAVAPVELKEMGDTEFIRVSSEVGLGFTRGTTPLNNWVVAWNADADTMRLTQAQTEANEEKPKIFQVVPHRQENPQTIITWKASEKTFNVRTRGVSISRPDFTMHYFVIREDDPNILYHHFSVQLLETMNRVGYDIPCNVDLPDRFSIYTKPDMERYQFIIE